MADIPGFVAYVAAAIATAPDRVVVTTTRRGQQHVVRLTVAPQDMGRVIAREGRVANAIRAVLRAAATEERWGLEIAD